MQEVSLSLRMAFHAIALFVGIVSTATGVLDSQIDSLFRERSEDQIKTTMIEAGGLGVLFGAVVGFVVYRKLKIANQHSVMPLMMSLGVIRFIADLHFIAAIGLGVGESINGRYLGLTMLSAVPVFMIWVGVVIGSRRGDKSQSK